MATRRSSEICAGERFEIRRRVGAGGMGEVYEAFDRERDMRVALKTLPRFDPELLYRFKQEFRNLTDVSHPNLIPLYELFSIETDWFFSMEYVDGVNFLDFMRPEGAAVAEPGTVPLSPDSPRRNHEQTKEGVGPLPQPDPGGRGERVARLPAAVELSDDGLGRLRCALPQLVEGVHALHRAGKLHRDIKPSNVLITPAGRVVVLDFGLSIGVRESAQPADVSRIIGTLRYMAPEQAMGQALTEACDWYAVGAMLYQALSGRLPYEARTLRSLREKQCSPAIPVQRLVPSVPDDLAALCEALLRRDPGERPTGREILRLLGIEDREAIRPQPALGGMPLVGRGAQLTTLREAFAELEKGRPRTLLLHGISGIGKSYLIEHFLEELGSEKSCVVLTGRCYEAESVPYKGLDSLIDALARRLVSWPPAKAAAVTPRDAHALLRVFPVLEQVAALRDAPGPSVELRDAQELRRRAFRGLRELLARLGDRCRLVLVIDDLQWGDMDSAALLSELLQPPDPPILLLVGVYRSEYESRSPSLRKLLAEVARPGASQPEILEVGPLSESESRALAATLLAEETAELGPWADRVAREAGGVPFFVHELVQHLRTRQGKDTGTRGSRISLEEVLRHRLGSLPGPARELLECICLAGRPVRQGDAYRAAGVSLSDLSALTLLRARHMVRGTGVNERDTVEPYHDRIREAAKAAISTAVLPRLHGQLATTLEEAGDYDAEMVGAHFEGAGETTRAADYFVSAADLAARTLAFDHAARLYRHAWRLRPLEGEPGRNLLTRLADALANAGRGAESARAYEEAMLGAEPQRALELQRRAALQFCISGHIDEGRQALEDLLARLGMKLPGSAAASLLRMLWYRLRLRLRGLTYRERQAADVPPETLQRCDVVWSASNGLSMIDIIDGAAFQTRALLLALAAGEPYRIARALAWEAVHIGNSGGRAWRQTQRLVSGAQELAEHCGRPHATGMATLADGVVRFFIGRWREADVRLERAIKTFREDCAGAVWELDTAHNFVLWNLFYQGEYAAMKRRLTPLLHEADDRGDLYLATSIRTYQEPMWMLTQDEPARARAEIRRALTTWAVKGFHLQTYEAVVLETHCDLYEGRVEDALRRIEQGWKDTRRAQLHRSQLLRILMYHLLGQANLAAAAEQPRRLRRASRLARRLRRERVGWAVALATLLEAGIVAARGASHEAARLYEAAAARLDAVEMQVYAAVARRRAGRLVGSERGRDLIAAADAWMAAQEVVDPVRLARAHVAEIPRATA